MFYDCALAVFLLHFVAETLSLQAPQRVWVESYNLHSVLRWNPVEPEGNTPIQYLVQYTISDKDGDGMAEWRNFSLCTLTADTQCNISNEARPYINMTFRVQAQTWNQTSSWSQTKPFNAFLQTELGPPNVTLSTENPNYLTVLMQPDIRLKKAFGVKLKYRISIEKENENLTSQSDESSSVIFRLLQAGAKYCVQVRYIIEQRLGRITKKQCAVIKEAENDRIIRIVWVSCLVVALFGGFVLGCIFLIYKNYDLLKGALRPAMQWPEYFDELLSREPFAPIPPLIPSNSEEISDNVSHVFMDTDADQNAGASSAES